MQGFITLLFLIGMFISWYVQQKRKKDEVEKKKERIKKLRESRKKVPVDLPAIEIEEDISNRHVKEEKFYIKEKEEMKPSPLKKIDKLSYIKKAIIWKEILDKPY